MDANKQAPKNILIADANPVVTAHLAGLVREAVGGNKFTPVLAEEVQSDQQPKFSEKNLFALLRTQEFSAILINGELGLGLGGKRGEDGQVIMNLLRKGEYGELNRNALIFSIFGDYRLKGAVGIVNNNMTLGLGGPFLELLEKTG